MKVESNLAQSPRHRAHVGALILLLALTLWAGSAVRAEERRPFTIGSILALSGPTAEYGEAIKNCIELAQRDNPEKFRNIRFIYEDAVYDPKQAVSAFYKLRNRDKVDLIHTWGISFCKALAPLAESSKTPMIAQCIDPGSGAGRRYVVRFMNYTDQYQALQTEYLARKNFKKIGVVLTDIAYLEEMYEALRRNVQPGQSVTIIDRYQSGQMDLRPTISKIARSEFDVIGVFLMAGQIAEFYKQAREQDMRKPTFGTNLYESLSELQAARGAMEGAVFASNEIHPQFIARYRQEFGRPSQLAFGGLAYELALMLAAQFGEPREDGAQQGGSALSADLIMARIMAGGSQSGVAAGPYVFRDDPRVGRFFQFPLVMKQVAGDEFTGLARAAVEAGNSSAADPLADR